VTRIPLPNAATASPARRSATPAGTPTSRPSRRRRAAACSRGRRSRRRAAAPRRWRSRLGSGPPPEAGIGEAPRERGGGGRRASTASGAALAFGGGWALGGGLGAHLGTQSTRAPRPARAPRRRRLPGAISNGPALTASAERAQRTGIASGGIWARARRASARRAVGTASTRSAQTLGLGLHFDAVGATRALTCGLLAPRSGESAVDDEIGEGRRARPADSTAQRHRLAGGEATCAVSRRRREPPRSPRAG
jgi:hypothetical protein